MRNLLITTALAMASLCAQAEGTLFKLPTRAGVKTTLFWEAAPGATATVLLFPGGAGGFGQVEAGRATGGNFLVRSVPHFLAQGLNVAIFGRPDDMPELGYADRTGAAHLADVRAVLAFVRQHSSAPVWLVGTSRGTVSATAAAIELQDAALAGVVLSSSVVKASTTGNVPGQNLAAIRLPVLVLHHRRDACALCRPEDVPAIVQGLVNAPVKKLLMVDGGANPEGEVCAARHWHGYIGMEAEAVQHIADWVRRPVP
jgi:hypothetical protein